MELLERYPQLYPKLKADFRTSEMEHNMTSGGRAPRSPRSLGPLQRRREDRRPTASRKLDPPRHVVHLGVVESIDDGDQPGDRGPEHRLRHPLGGAQKIVGLDPQGACELGQEVGRRIQPATFDPADRRVGHVGSLPKLPLRKPGSRADPPEVRCDVSGRLRGLRHAREGSCRPAATGTTDAQVKSLI